MAYLSNNLANNDLKKLKNLTLIQWLFKLIKILLTLFTIFIIFTVLATTIVVYNSGDPEFQYEFNDHWVNNVSQINSVRVAKEISPRYVTEIVTTITNTSGPISIGGGRYSQGGQIAYPDSLHIDMRKFNKVLAFDKTKKTITVQTGIRWRDIQEYIDPYNLSLKIMQTYSNFTVGGSLSVNVHGRYVGEGPLVNSVKQITLVLANGEVITASPTINPELFYGAIGGYGGIGVIVEAQLQLVDNVKVERTDIVMPVSEYKNFFLKYISPNPDAVFTNADIYPPDYQIARSVTWYETDKKLTQQARLIPRDEKYVWSPRIIDWISDISIGYWVRQYIIDPIIYISNPVEWRNYEASYDVGELEPKDRTETTYVLREYFIPVDKFDAFVPKMRDIFNKYDANIINVSIRHASQDPGTLLAWAKTDVFAFVVYYKQGTSREDQQNVKLWSRKMNTAAITLGGSYYLPYQIYETREQFIAAYPNAQKYFLLKKSIDPNYRFRNQLWAKLYPEAESNFDKDKIAQYFRGEEQTFLTIPEWYLVFNPQEYADYLQSGKSPSDFPFWQSINEYWKLYDRSINISKNHYPPNKEYQTMLQVIGISTTIEYMYKGTYEKSVGRLTWWLADSQTTPEDKLISQAQTAYSNLIYNEAWYKFNFMPWIKKVWQEDFFGTHFVRKLERKLFFTFEFGLKAIYAQIIGYVAQSSYETSDGLIYMNALGNSNTKIDPEIKVIYKNKEHYLLGVPRWGKFTEKMPELVKTGLTLDDISGNTRLAASFLGEDNNINLSYSHSLFSSNLVSNPKQKRIYVYMPVNQLQKAIDELNSQGFELEHLYDY